MQSAHKQPLQFCIRLVADFLAPFIAGILPGNFNGQMGEPAILRRAVPMLYPGGNVHHVSGQKKLRLFPPFLIVALSGHADEDLPAALVCLVDMPVIPAGGLKCYVEDADLFF